MDIRIYDAETMKRIGEKSYQKRLSKIIMTINERVEKKSRNHKFKCLVYVPTEFKYDVALSLKSFGYTVRATKVNNVLFIKWN